MVYSLGGYTALTVGTIAFGLCLDYNTHLSALLLSQCVLGQTHRPFFVHLVPRD